MALVLDLLTFEQQIGPVMLTIVTVYGWLLTVNLIGHRTRTLPRRLTRVGLLLGAGLLVALVLVAAGYVLPGLAGRLTAWVGYGLGSAAWLALPVYTLLLSTRVFTSSATSDGRADAEHTQGAARP